MFIQYPKIFRVEKEENEGLLDSEVTIQEKIDGANTSIWIEGGEIKCGSRRKELTEGFNGFVDYVKSHTGINKLLTENPTFRLYGEWLVRHTISYRETAYKQFYLFDVFVDDNYFMSQDMVNEVAISAGLPYPQIFAKGKLTQEQIKEYVGKTNIGDVGEGVVIKNPTFVNKFGNHSYGKMVAEKFKEDNALIFGGNNKHSETYWEMYIINKYATLARVQKVMYKIQPIINERLDKQHTSRMCDTCYNDMLTEEIWDISKKVDAISFKKLKTLSYRKFKQIYHDILDDNISIADI